MKPGGSSEKGKRGEREACDLLRPVFREVRRSAMQGRGGHEQPDLLGTPGWWVEVGVGDVSPRRKWEQAAVDCDRRSDAELMAGHQLGHVPIAMTRSDRGEWLVTMRAEDWLELASSERTASATATDSSRTRTCGRSSRRAGK